MNKPLRILMVLHMPWSRNLGGPRVQVELADEFRAMGHEVEKFDYNDAFPEVKSSSLVNLFNPHFSVKAKAYVQANAHRFDIIDAHQGNLPFSKEELGFKGLLVARSVGLYSFYERFAKPKANVKQPPQKIKTRLANLLRSWQYQRNSRLYPQSLETCDLINVPNSDELDYISNVLGLGHKCVVIPYGLSSQRQKAFAEAIQPAQVRLANKQVVFIGNWGVRKGSRDWAKIIMRVREQVPDAKFLFLGTEFGEKRVLEELNLPACDWIQIVPSFDGQKAPELLSKATVGAFPSYMEGFSFATLEKLAAGLPTVVYNVPGPKHQWCYVDDSLLIPPGDTEKFGDKLISLLKLDTSNYSQLSQRCVEVANKFLWKEIAEKTLNIYTKTLSH